MRHLHLLLGVWLPLGALAGNVAHAGNIIVGVHVNNIESMTEQQQDALVALLRQHGVKTVRTGIGGAFNHFIIGAHRANIGTLAGVPPTAASKAHWHRVGNTPDAPWVGPSLTDADPEKFKAWLGAALAPLETAGVPLTAFELGNEINLSGENGDLPVPPAGQARELGLADLKNPNDPDGRAVAASYRAYLRVMAALKDVRDHSAVNRRTPIITAGLSDTGPPGKQPSWKVDSVSIPATIEFMRENGLDDLVDGYGVHFYPSNYDPNTPVRERIHGLEERALAPCTRAKPCWLTEWGFANPNLSCPIQDEVRLKLFRTEREAFKTFVNEGRLAAAILYNWESKPRFEYPSVFRCGALTEAGKLALSPM
jgi:hypothetical protein